MSRRRDLHRAFACALIVAWSLAPTVNAAAEPKLRADGLSLRVMTYNIHSCKGRDGKIRPERIAAVIRAAGPDVVALQEVRVGRVDPKSVDRPKSVEPGKVPPPVGESPLPPPEVVAPRRPGNTAPAKVPFTDQPGAIAEALGMYHVFYPLVRSKRQDYGIAILSRHPMRVVRAANLPVLTRRLFSEQRGAVWVEVDVNGVKVQLLNTHLGLSEDERIKQVETLLGKDWMGSADFRSPYVLCGDFNARPNQRPYRRLIQAAADAPHAVHGKNARPTWPSARAFFRLDHVFIPKSGRALSAEVPRTDLTRVSSDHLPVVVDLKFDPRG